MYFFYNANVFLVHKEIKVTLEQATKSLSIGLLFL